MNVSVRENYDGSVKGYKSMIPTVKLVWRWIYAAYDSIRWWNKKWFTLNLKKEWYWSTFLGINIFPSPLVRNTNHLSELKVILKE